ncbi:TRAP transporter TatT component family protein [Desulfopila aestuarii]|uniref:TRAP transporter T-component n=1 Tax=Desulfopila aestuarii DSM 18488 TaxID=1121416 RepID=A0A1M7XWQ8_9BACT|nr:TRAP transporter TatT component family protein [Desulfopila aestuarii]SHO43246.1 TRAP transporter T-component [Desulfopila aestuarii DSM 18488]
MSSGWTSAVICRFVFVLAILPFMSSCSTLLSNTLIEPTVANLQKQTDLDLVCEGSPAYLLMIDSLIASDPESRNLLRVGSQAYSGYLAAMTECGLPEERIDAVAQKSRLYGTTLIAQMLPIAPGTDAAEFEKRLAGLRSSQVPDLFWGTLAWLGWIQAEQGAPAAMADLATVEKIMARLLELDESYQMGSPHLFFGAYYATRPPMFGGDPEKSAQHFEKALAFSHHRFLMVQATYAETLARQLFDRELHDRLLQEVMDFPIGNAPDQALSNQIAKRRAQRLLEEDFFAE